MITRERETETREKIQARLKRLRERLFHAEMSFAFHDREGLKEMARGIMASSSKILRLLAGKSRTAFRKKRRNADIKFQ